MVAKVYPRRASTYAAETSKRYTNVELIVAQKSDVVTLPRSSIIQQDGKPTCFVVTADGVIVRKGLQTGITTPTDIEIVTGLDGSENVISANTSAFQVISQQHSVF